MTDRCEVCDLAKPRYGVGFPDFPGTLPDLPGDLRGMCLWVCGAPDCDLKAQKRAAQAAAKSGLTLKTIWRHYPARDSIFPTVKEISC